MGRACAVPKCKTGYKSVKEKCSVFTVPRNTEQFKKWQAAIPGIVLRQSQCVCEKHFEQKYILKEWVYRDPEGRIIAKAPYLHPRLVETAIPTIFDNFTSFQKPTEGMFDGSNSLEDKCQSIKCEIFEQPLTDPLDTECADASYILPCAPQEIIQPEVLPVTFIPRTASASLKQEVVDSESILCRKNFVLSKITIKDSTSSEVTSKKNRITCAPHEIIQPEVAPVTFIPRTASASPKQEVVNSASIMCRKNFVLSKITIKDSTSNEVTSEKNPITIPTSWGVTEFTEDRGQRLVFSNIICTDANSMIINKSVVVKADKTLRYCVYGRLIDSERFQLPSVLTDTTLLPKILETFRRLNVCQGLDPVNIHHLPVDSVFQDSVKKWRDNDCTILAKQKRCEHCKKMRQRTLQRESRSDKTENIHRIRHLSNPIDDTKLISLRKKITQEQRANKYLKRRVQLLTESLKGKAKEISSIRAEAFDEKLSQLQVPASQQTAIKEMISAAKKRDTKSRRYSEDWIMLCTLMHIRSPSYYEFLRKNEVLPLPCPRTIHTFNSQLNVNCGFDKHVGQLLKKHFDTKTEQQRHGVLLLDETNLRKSVAMCSSNLSNDGPTDIGDDGPQSIDIQEQATHGLVLMFQSIADSYTKPITVFASKNPMKGEELAKQVIKAIIYLEMNGATIHGVIADDVATNAQMWSVLDVSGAMKNTKTYFTHPLDDDRKVFVFSDTSRVVKNFRNQLYTNKKLRIFSNSVAQDSSQEVVSFTGCEETIQFCAQIDRMFDALNRKSPDEGLTPKTEDFKVLQDSITWLNDWESTKKKGDITADDYLTWQMSQALRLSLQSTIDLCRYLIDKFSFKYLLAGKVNQHNLESDNGE